MLWFEKQVDPDQTAKLAERLSLSPLLAHLLVSRGIEEPKDAQNFLEPKLRHLSDPFLIDGMDEAVNRIIQAIEQKESVLIIGDYDVDGITSTVIVTQVLEFFNTVVNHVIPERVAEGYGLTSGVVERGLSAFPCQLVIALDCGTNSKTETESILQSGRDVIVVDHHQLKTERCERAILVNPHLEEDAGEPWYHLCTAGLAFKLAHALIKKLREIGHPRADQVSPKQFLPLCAMGTLADLVPLQKENRILSRYGLRLLGHKPSPGLSALLKESALADSDALECEDVTFKIAPRINACGRIGSAEDATRLLLEKDHRQCRTLASQLTDFNEQRKKIEAELTRVAISQAEEKFADSPAVVVHGQGHPWHQGVVGIVAGKMSQLLGKPCLVLAQAPYGEYKGSGRGLAGDNLVKHLEACDKYLTHWGGHPLAVGLGLRDKELESFIESFLSTFQNLSNVEQTEPKLEIDLSLSPEDIRPELVAEIGKLEPFGQDNPEPVICIQGIALETNPRKVGNGDHFQFSIRNSAGLVQGIAWRMSDRMPPTEKKIDLAFRLKWNCWNGRRKLQMVLEDWRESIDSKDAFSAKSRD